VLRCACVTPGNPLQERPRRKGTSCRVGNRGHGPRPVERHADLPAVVSPSVDATPSVAAPPPGFEDAFEDLDPVALPANDGDAMEFRSAATFAATKQTPQT
jgi:hypothetical protein